MSAGLARGALKSLRRKETRRQRRSSIPAARSGGDEWEVERSSLRDLTEVGSGQFGKVYVAFARGIVKGEAETRVAVKTLNDPSPAASADFLSEVKVMQQIDGSRRVVRLLGVCTKETPMYMVMEYISRGDLKEVLVAARPEPGRPAPFSHRQHLQMGSDVAEGMQHLAGLNVVHRDLAARNVLVTDGFTCKIGDFGLTRKTYSREYYRMTGSSPLPIRWMAPECLEDGLFSTNSDLWAYGVVLWEIATFGRIPYPRLDNQQVVERVVEEEYRLDEPLRCPPGLYAIMLQCWAEEPTERGAFDEKRAALQDLALAAPDAPISRDGPATPADDGDAADLSGLYDGADAAGGYEVPAVGGYETPTALRDRAADADEAEVMAWLARRSGTDLDAADPEGALKSGEVLCLALEAVRPGLIPEIHRAKPGKTLCALFQMENISHFLVAAIKLGVANDDLFDVEDLFEGEDMDAVMDGVVRHPRLPPPSSSLIAAPPRRRTSSALPWAKASRRTLRVVPCTRRRAPRAAGRE